MLAHGHRENADHTRAAPQQERAPHRQPRHGRRRQRRAPGRHVRCRGGGGWWWCADVNCSGEWAVQEQCVLQADGGAVCANGVVAIAADTIDDVASP